MRGGRQRFWVCFSVMGVYRKGFLEELQYMLSDVNVLQHSQLYRQYAYIKPPQPRQSRTPATGHGYDTVGSLQEHRCVWHTELHEFSNTGNENFPSWADFAFAFALFCDPPSIHWSQKLADSLTTWDEGLGHHQWGQHQKLARGAKKRQDCDQFLDWRPVVVVACSRW